MPPRCTMACSAGKIFLKARSPGRAEEDEGIGFEIAHRRSICAFAAQPLEFLQQFERESHAGQIDAEVALQTQRDARPAQRCTAEAPLRCIDFQDAEHAFLHQFDDVPLIDGESCATDPTTLSTTRSSTISPDSGSAGAMALVYTPRLARGLNGIAAAIAR